MAAESAIAQTLLSLIKTVRREDLFPSYSLEASRFVAQTPLPLQWQSVLTARQKWISSGRIPYDLKNEWGHLDPYRIANMSLDELGDVFRRLPHKPKIL